MGQHLMGAVLCLVQVMLQVTTSGLCPVNAPFSLLAYLLQPALALCVRHAYRCYMHVVDSAQVLDACTCCLCQTCIEEPMAPHGVGP